ncbi:Receptor-type adenylate cyclase [Seminavis robusta]|uniref:Receptor-type adenylate cyclase n=1 Tax=Seminavis robusta TaxID=568900 RepID=A0A9N8D979_9STRA|nr:Receptor-type adenylate cyclase [Seminavis robusta]|eukprot:Sro21_g014670.1 Receptor-type adenylate cyclase (667) ;mRNA; r:74446-76446
MGAIGSKSLTKYSKSEIADIVAAYGSGYQCYVKEIAGNCIDGELLASLSEQEFVETVLDDLKVTNRIHRRKFLHVFRSAVFGSAEDVSASQSVKPRRGSLTSTASSGRISRQRRCSLNHQQIALLASTVSASPDPIKRSMTPPGLRSKTPMASSPALRRCMTPVPPGQASNDATQQSAAKNNFGSAASRMRRRRSCSPGMVIPSRQRSCSQSKGVVSEEQTNLESSASSMNLSSLVAPRNVSPHNRRASFSDPKLLKAFVKPTRRRSFTTRNFSKISTSPSQRRLMEEGRGLDEDSSTADESQLSHFLEEMNLEEEMNDSFLDQSLQSLSQSLSQSQSHSFNTVGQDEQSVEQSVLIDDMLALFDRQYQENESLRESMSRLEVESLQSRKCSHAPKSGKAAIVLTDVEGSTALWEADPNAMRKALEVHDKIVRQICCEYFGYEIDTEGDAFFLAFHEASDAVSFALDLQEALNGASWSDDILHLPWAREAQGRRGLRVRASIGWGDVEARQNSLTGRTFYVGQAWDISRKIGDLAKGGQILCNDETWQCALRRLDSDLWDFPLVANLGLHPVSWCGYTFNHILELAPASMPLVHDPAPKTKCDCRGASEKKGLRRISTSDAALNLNDTAMAEDQSEQKRLQQRRSVAICENMAEFLVSLDDGTIFF